MIYKYVNNNSDKLVVVFQGVNQGNVLSSNRDMYRKISLFNKKWNKLFVEKHNKYSYFKLFDNKGVDLLFVADAFSDCIGWYALDKGKDVTDKVSKFIDGFVKENGYKADDVYLFGNSKGAFASLLYINKLNNVNNVVCSYPIVKPGLRYKKLLKKPEQLFVIDQMRGKMTKEDMFDYLDSMLVANGDGKKINVILGVNDQQTNDFQEIYEGHTVNIKWNLEELTHGQYSKQSIPILTEFFEELGVFK